MTLRDTVIITLSQFRYVSGATSVVEKKPTYQIRKEMKEIGHSMKTGIEEYGWRFSNLAQLMKDEPELFD